MEADRQGRRGASLQMKKLGKSDTLLHPRQVALRVSLGHNESPALSNVPGSRETASTIET